MSRQPLFLHPSPIELAWNDPAANLERIDAETARGLQGVPDTAARLFIFPELTLTGFVTDAPRGLEAGGPELARLSAIAKARHTGIVAGFPEKNPAAPERPFNALVLVGPDGRVRAHYRKLHLFTFGAKPETECYSAGDKGVLCEYRGWRIGLSICFDLRFAPLFHRYAREKADLIVLPSCWVDGPHKSRQFEALAAGQAVLTQAYFAAVNRAGSDPAFKYDGSAHVFSPFGERVSKGGPCELSGAVVDEARLLSVRPSDRASYPL